jgi:hypothetical protein
MFGDGYVKLINNPVLTAEAKKARMDSDPITGEKIPALAQGWQAGWLAVRKFLSKKLWSWRNRQGSQ